MERVTIGDLFDRVAVGAGDREAAVFVDHDVRWSYRELHARVVQVAKGLIGLGIEAGDHVAVWATNWPEWVLLQFATAKIGAVLVTVNPAYRSDELAYVLEQSDAVALFLIERFRTSSYVDLFAACCPEIAAARPGRLASRRFPRLKRVALLGDAVPPSGMLAWADVLAAGAGVTDHMLRRRQEAVDPGDPVNVQYTSGTTGFPKGAELTHVNLANNAYYAGECLRLTARDRLCVPVPFYHCFGCVLGTLAAVVRGATLVVPAEHFDPEKTLAAAAGERCTVLHGVPTMFIAMLDHPRFAEFDLTALRTGIMAGAPCPIEVMRRVVRDMHAREMTIAYGQTEASPVITQTRTDDPLELRVSTVGRPLPKVEVKILDPDGRELPRGEQGELCCRGYLVMRGYYKMPEATAAAIDPAGWLHTGDLATMDERGYCRITGRIKDMVIRGGENVYPREIEEFLHRHPKVSDVQVFGVPDPLRGEEVAAWIRLVDGETATEEEMRAWCRERIAHYKVPRYIRFVDAFPMTVTGKVQKFKMREAMARELGVPERS